jgi:hypothetical protein
METDNLIAEGDYVVQQGRGVGRKTKSGEPYNNTLLRVPARGRQGLRGNRIL